MIIEICSIDLNINSSKNGLDVFMLEQSHLTVILITNTNSILNSNKMRSDKTPWGHEEGLFLSSKPIRAGQGTNQSQSYLGNQLKVINIFKLCECNICEVSTLHLFGGYFPCLEED